MESNDPLDPELDHVIRKINILVYFRGIPDFCSWKIINSIEEQYVFYDPSSQIDFQKRGDQTARANQTVPTVDLR